MLDSTASEPTKLRVEAKAYITDGHRATKLRFRCGPADGVRGNEEPVADVREAADDDTEVMADAYMGWDSSTQDVPSAAKYRLAWIGESFLPDDRLRPGASSASTRSRDCCCSGPS